MARGQPLKFIDHPDKIRAATRDASCSPLTPAASVMLLENSDIGDQKSLKTFGSLLMLSMVCLKTFSSLRAAVTPMAVPLPLYPGIYLASVSASCWLIFPALAAPTCAPTACSMGARAFMTSFMVLPLEVRVWIRSCSLGLSSGL